MAVKRKNIWEDERTLVLMLVLLYLLIRIPLLTHMPLLQDENIYSIMIEEQVAHPTLMPTFLGYGVPWKPPLFFWVYAPFAAVLARLPVPIEAVYRLPTMLFGLANVLLVFYTTRRVWQHRPSANQVAFFTTLIYVACFLVLWTDDRAMMDTLAMTFILGSVFAYLKASENSMFFLAAGVLSFLAFFTKQLVAAVAPIFILAYLFQHDRSKLRDPLFLCSLVFIPLAFLATNYLLFNSPGQAYTAYSELIKQKLADNLNPDNIEGSIIPLFMLAGAWLFLSIFGFVKWWRENLGMAAWYALIIFPLIGGVWMPFYYLPVMPPVAYFSALLLLRDEKNRIVTDRFMLFVFCLIALTGFVMGALLYNDTRPNYLPQKEAGELLVSKENVAIIGGYAPGIMAYKVLEEKRLYGKWLDFGWILTTNSTQKDLDPFILDYHHADSNVINGSFVDMFSGLQTYRKDTNITHFDYLVLVSSNDTTASGSILYHNRHITVYER